MTHWFRGALATMAALFVGSEMRAQVGYDPRHSPYRDLRESQEVSFFTGYYRARLDPAQVVPRAGPMVGARYQWRAGGPAHVTFDAARVSSERQVLDPEKSSCPSDPSTNCKLIGTYRWPLYLADVGLALSLTGARSFYRLVPEVKAGAGIATDFHTQPDVGDFAFGTRFAFTWGAGIRWVPGGRYQLRADFTNHLYAVRYPETYYQAADDGSRIFDAAARFRSKSIWLNNPGFTIGVSYLFSR